MLFGHGTRLLNKPCVGRPSALGNFQPHPRKLARLATRVTVANQLASYESIRSTADQAYARACELLPAYEEALRIAGDAGEPAAEAEKQWQEAHNILTAVAGTALAAITELRNGAEAALGGGETIITNMLRHHSRYRLEAFKNNLHDVTLWRKFKPTITPLTWLPGAALLTQAAACTSQDVPYLVACVSVAMPPLHDNLRSMLLHWSVADGPGAGWANSIPQGWHTSPGVSQPCGATAWQTAFGPHAPVIEGQAASAAPVLSVIVQIPLEGFLEERGGLKFVLKRSDGGQPEWIKPHNNSDFWLDFSEPIAVYQRIQAKVEAAAALAARQLITGPDTESLLAADSLDAWGWARAMSSQENGISSDSESGTDDEMEEEKRIQKREEREIRRALGWLKGVSHWEMMGDYPPQQPLSLSHQLQQLRIILKAAQAQGLMRVIGGQDAAQRAKQIDALLSRCHEVDETLQKYDAASLEARHAQQERERLWELHKSASDEASRLQAELNAAMDGARRSAVALRGRQTEVTQRDLEAVAVQMAEFMESSTGGGGLWPLFGFGGSNRKLAFVSQVVAPISGMDATVLVQVHLEGEKKAVQAALAPKKPEEISPIPTESGDESATAGTSPSSSSEGEIIIGPQLPSDFAEAVPSPAAVEKKEPLPAPTKQKSKPKPAFDTIVVSVAVAEAFPNNALRAPILLHFGAVPHHNGKWGPPPPGWKSYPAEGSAEGAPPPSAPGSLPWVPLQQFTITRVDGSPVFVDPVLHGACLRFPLAEVADCGARGIEFVLKTTDGNWLQPGSGNGGNFYVELPALGK